MKKAIILHGTMGSPEGNWFRWLESEFLERGFEVWVPQLPNPQQPSLAECSDFVQAECPFVIDENTLIVGHSSGSILAVVVAQKYNNKIGAIVCVSAFHDNSLGWDANNKLFDVQLNCDNVAKNVETRLFLHSDDDPYLPIEQGEFVAKACDGEFLVIPGQGHFNLEKSESYKQFPLLLKLLQSRNLI